MKDKTKVKARNVGKVAEILAEDPNVTRRDGECRTFYSQYEMVMYSLPVAVHWPRFPEQPLDINNNNG